MHKLFLGLTLFASASMMAHAQSAPPCDGAISRIRVSDIKPGMFPLYEKAAAAQLAWYRSKGITTNNVFVIKMYERDGKTYSETQAMTIHFNPPISAGKEPQPDDAYKAFVKMYNDSSAVKQTYDVCMPKTFTPQ